MTAAWGAPDAASPLGSTTIERREVGPTDVAIDITYCGICHSDVHAARNEWGGTNYPVVPGHEIVGLVTAVGADVTRHAVGDPVGVAAEVTVITRSDREPVNGDLLAGNRISVIDMGTLAK